MNEKVHRKLSSIYLAASGDDMDRAAHWFNHLTLAGITCTSGWMQAISDNGNVANPRDASREERLKWSDQNLNKIAQADVLWYLVSPTAHGRGGYYESGYATALGKIVIFSGDTLQSIFCAKGSEYVDDLAAFAKVCRLIKDGAWV